MNTCKSILVVADMPLYRFGVKVALTSGDLSSIYKVYETESLGTINDNEKVDLIILSSNVVVKKTDIKSTVGDDTTPILILSDNIDRSVFYKARTLGAKGIVSGYAAFDELHRAVENVLKGGFSWPKRSRKAGSIEEGDVSKNTIKIPPLTIRQEQVLKYLKSGLSNKQIGHHLEISENTVKTHMSAILRKYGEKTRIKLVSRLSN